MKVCIKPESPYSEKYHKEHDFAKGGTQCGAGFTEKVDEEQAFEDGYRPCESCFPDTDDKDGDTE